MNIFFNRPCLSGRELEYIADAVTHRMQISGAGHYTDACQKLLEQAVGVRKALLTTSCTDALEMAALLCRLEPDDEVIVPSFTFVSTVNAFVLRGVRPVFADVRPDTLNIDETRLHKLIGPRTRAIVVVHYAGVGCEMDAILELARGHGIEVIEDNAHGLFGRYRGRQLGTMGGLATLSFHETKNISCGEGGALLINDEKYAERAEILREKGTNRTRFRMGLVDKYSWVDVGSSFLPSEILAAFLYAQLEEHQRIQSRRGEIWQCYARELKPWAAENGVLLPTVPAHCEQAYHMFYVLLPTLKVRQALIAHLRERGIGAVFHYLPLHISDMGRRFGGREGDCPVSEEMSDRLLRLPFYNDLTQEEQLRVVAAVQEFDCLANS